MSELKPCPFCGESKLLYSGGCGFRYDDDDNQIRLFRVNCRTCKGRTGLFESLDEAVEAWNRRTNSTTIQPPALSTNLAEVGMDCISREAVLNEFCHLCDGWSCNPNTCCKTEWIRKLPPIQPAEPKKGTWIEDKGQQTLMRNFIERGEVWRVCSVCGAGHMIGYKYATDKAYHDRHHNYCPNCGADMRGKQDG